MDKIMLNYVYWKIFVNNNKYFCRTCLILLCLIVITLSADYIIAASSGGDLPYEDWLAKLRDSVTGPVAFTISIIGLVAAGAGLIFGGDMNTTFRTLILIVLVMALLVGATNFMSSFFGRGAII
jgi:type IV secretion system protein VirB2